MKKMALAFVLLSAVAALGTCQVTPPPPSIRIVYQHNGTMDTVTGQASVVSGGSVWTSTTGAPTANCAVGSIDTNTSATSASTVLYVCYPTNTRTAVTVP